MKVGHEIPANATAARVMARGEHFEFRALETEVCSATPLPTKATPDNAEELSGRKFGRLRVIGMAEGVRGRWVCKCLCGNYVHRKASAIKQAAADSSCPQCYLLAVSKAKDFLRRTGRRRETVEFMQ